MMYIFIICIIYVIVHENIEQIRLFMYAQVIDILKLSIIKY